MGESKGSFSLFPVPCCGLARDKRAGDGFDGEVAVEGADCCFDAVFAFHFLGYSLRCLDGLGVQKDFDGTCEGGGVESFAVEGAGTGTGCEDHVCPEWLAVWMF